MSTDLSTNASAVINEALFRRVIEDAFTRANLDVLDDIISPDIKEHQPGMGTGPEGVKAAITFLHTAFPDFRLAVEDLVVDGDKVWGRMRATGTHTGPLGHILPTGKRMDITVMDVCRFEGGKMVEHWGVPDRFTQMHQLGLLPRG